MQKDSKTLVVALKGDDYIDGRNKYAFNENIWAEAFIFCCKILIIYWI